MAFYHSRFGLTKTSVSAPATLYNVYMWGNGSELPFGNSTALSSPVQFGTKIWKSISDKHIVKSDDTQLTWSQNNFDGSLGLGTTVGYSTPVLFASTPWKTFSKQDSTFYHGIKADGTLWATGQDNNAFLGLGTVGVNKSTFTQVGSLTTWTSVIGTSAIKSDGTLWTWGINTAGKLGLGDTAVRSVPTQVGALTTWSKTAMGNSTYAIKSDGTLWAWGDNTYGQLGLGNTTSVSTPVQVGNLTNWSQISSKGKNFVAIKTDGTLWGCGDPLGLGFSVGVSSPVILLAGTWSKAVTGSRGNTFALKSDGTFWCCGYNQYGTLGNNTGSFGSNRVSFAQLGSDTTWIDVVVYDDRIMALKTT